MNRIFAVLALLASIMSPSAVLASVPDGTRIGNDMLRPLADWVSRTMGVKIHNLPIATASGRILKSSLGLEGIQQARSTAAYLPGQIIVNNIIWDPESIRSQSYVLHELVHHAQLLGGKRYPCHSAKEREAYELQNRWLAEQGEDALFSESWINEMSNCRT
jgi:hypothetical protein